ncbi:MAG: hypothetical protein WCA79_19840 [Anaerolineales bacterium]
MFLFRLLGRLVGGLVNLVLWLALIAVIVGGLLIVGPSFGLHTERLNIPAPVSSALSGVETTIPSVFESHVASLAQITPPALPEAFYPPILQDNQSPSPDSQSTQAPVGTPTLDTDMAGFLPNPSLTPGVIDPRVTQANIKSTICKKGYTASVRPPESYTEPLKKKDIALYGYADTKLADYEMDHLVPLEVGGSPTDPQNLWPEPHKGEWNSFVKDQLENKINALICDGQISLAAGQDAFITNWIEAYQKYISPTPIDGGGTSSSSGD